MRKSKTGKATFLVLILTVVLLFGQKLLAAQAADIAILVDGERLSCDVPPVIEQGRTLVPLRAIFEALGAEVAWDGKTRTITGRKGDVTVKLVVRQKTAYVNGRAITLDVPPKIVNGRTMVPLRFVGESLGARVEWDGVKRVVIVRKGSRAGEDGSRWITVAEYFVTPRGEVEKRAVRVPCPPQRVVVLGGYPAEMIKALGVEKAVVGIDEYTKSTTQWPEYVLKVPDVGRASTPSVEKIVALKPDLVIEAFMKPELRSQLTRAGIPVFRIYGYKTELLPAEIRSLGMIFNCRARANSYAAYIEKQWNTVKERTKKLTSRQKPKVYWESSFGDWRTLGPGSGAHPLIIWAGGINIAAELGLSYPTVTPEWVAAKNPDVIIKYLKRKQAGWTIKGTKEAMQRLEKIRRQIMNRPALRHTNAVKHGRVYLISDLITCAPRGAAGEYYIAKWLHPELFKERTRRRCIKRCSRGLTRRR